MRTGDRVRLNTPDNPRLHGTLCTVQLLEEWGARVICDAAATGQYRAHWSEMQTIAPFLGYTGHACSQCGSINTRQNGTCLLCDNCGSTTGCS